MVSQLSKNKLRMKGYGQKSKQYRRQRVCRRYHGGSFFKKAFRFGKKVFKTGKKVFNTGKRFIRKNPILKVFDDQ